MCESRQASSSSYCGWAEGHVSEVVESPSPLDRPTRSRAQRVQRNGRTLLDFPESSPCGGRSFRRALGITVRPARPSSRPRPGRPGTPGAGNRCRQSPSPLRRCPRSGSSVRLPDRVDQGADATERLDRARDHVRARASAGPKSIIANRAHTVVYPASATSPWPLTIEAASEQSQAKASAISSGWPQRWFGSVSAICS
jgi:hypothetical protein